MKPALILLLIPILFAATPGLHGQGTFQNLDFESAVVPLDPPSVLPLEQAFPGWSASIGSNAAGGVVYNNFTLSAASLSLFSNDGYPRAVAGSFTAFLKGTHFRPNGDELVPPEVSIFQTGWVPLTSQSLTFIASSPSQYGYLAIDVSLGGQSLFVTPLETTANYTIYCANIAAFAGQTTELKFTARAGPSHRWDYGQNTWVLDNINFSDQAVPEPGAVYLLGLAAMMFIPRFRKCRSQ